MRWASGARLSGHFAAPFAYHRGVPRLVSLALSLAVVLIGLATARAEVKRTVKVETTPPGAAVYVGDKDGEPVGTTPLDLKLAPGEYILIIELEGYVEEFKTVSVPEATGRAAKQPIEVDPILMQAAVSILEVKGTAPPGSKVLLDGEDRGELPLHLEIPPGAHQVQVMSGTTAIWDEWVELEGGQEHVVTVSPVEVTDADPPDDEPRRPRPPVVIARAGPEVGWRAFRYSGAVSGGNTPPYSSKGLVMFRFEAEVAPWRLTTKARAIWPLTLVVGGGFAPADRVTQGQMDADQFWRTTEVGLRYRLPIGRYAKLGFDAGWARLLYTFRGDLQDQLPDVDYQNVRLGIRGEVGVGPVAGWIGAENRLVASGGALPGRFESADTDGVALKIGVLGRFWRGRLEAGTEYQLSRFGWDFTYDAQMGEFKASGGTDRFDAIRLWVGGAY